MTKYEKISVLAKETARSIGENKESWMNYLDVASRLYKYPFEDQILIITADDIGHVLMGDSGFVHGNFRIYDFYQKEHTQKDAIEFLKHEYGTGGSTHAMAGADHSYKDYDAKGLKLRKGEIFTPDAEVLLSWNVVAKRIEKLIQEDRYLSEEKKIKYAEYKREQEEKALEKAKKELEQKYMSVSWGQTDNKA